MKKLGSLLFSFIIFAPFYLLNAQTVDILWQGETYTPPFYEGRALWSKQSMVTLVAMPNGLGSPSSLNYKWTKNGTILGDINGIGKNTIRFEDTIFSKSQTIKVQIVTEDDRILAESTLVVKPISSTPLVYEKSPLYGYLFNREVGPLYPIREEEVTFTAFPLFATPATREGANLTYKWTTNSGEVEVGDSVTYRAPEEASGIAQVRLSISNKDKILLDIVKDFLVKFGED